MVGSYAVAPRGPEVFLRPSKAIRIAFCCCIGSLRFSKPRSTSPCKNDKSGGTCRNSACGAIFHQSDKPAETLSHCDRLFAKNNRPRHIRIGTGQSPRGRPSSRSRNGTEPLVASRSAALPHGHGQAPRG
jgi:hypothetical protein